MVSTYFDSHPTVVLGILAAAAAVVVFPLFAIASIPYRLFGWRALASGSR